MASISPQQFCETLYCTTTPFIDFQVGADAALSIVASVTDARTTTEHRVRFADVEGLRWTPEAVSASAPGDLLEFSVVEVERIHDKWRVWLNPWYFKEVEFHCTSIMLDNAEVVGTGRWLQDDMPAQSAL